jgi:hypothetical protein
VIEPKPNPWVIVWLELGAGVICAWVLMEERMMAIARKQYSFMLVFWEQFIENCPF